MPTSTYLNIITFPVPIEFKNAALGIRRTINVGGLKGVIYLPTQNIPEIGQAFSELRPPAVRNIDLATRIQNLSADPDISVTSCWGRYFTWHLDDVEKTAIASVQRAAVAFPAPQGNNVLSVESLAQKCIAQFPTWGARLADWIEVLTGQDLNASHPWEPAVSKQRWTSTAWIYPAVKKVTYTYVNSSLSVYFSKGEQALDAEGWTSAIRAANSGRDIPDVWALVRDARAAQRRRLYRRAILDAATAAELIIDRQLRGNLLKINSATFVARLMKGTWQVSKRIDMMESLGLWLPNDIEANVSTLRNRVIHSNANVTASEGRKAVDTVEQLARCYERKL